MQAWGVLEGWGEPTRTLVPWRQGFRLRRKREVASKKKVQGENEEDEVAFGDSTRDATGNDNEDSSVPRGPPTTMFPMAFLVRTTNPGDSSLSCRNASRFPLMLH